MNLIKLSTKQPISVAVGILFCFLAGIVAFQIVPVQMTPEVDDTVIAVTTHWENASPQEIESEVIDAQEEKLQGLANLRNLSSVSSRGQGVIRLEFNQGIDKDVALREVSDKLREVPSYPTNVDEPVIEASDPDSKDYIAWYVLASEDDDFDVRRLQDFTDDRVKPLLERVSGISEVNVLGGTEQEVQIHFDALRLAQFKMPLSELVAALQSNNQNTSGGSLIQGKSDVRIRTVGRFSSPQDIENVVIRNDETGVIRVSDVAIVEESYKEATAFVRSNGRRVLALNFQRELGSNVLDIMDELQQRIDKLNSPGGVLAAESKRLALKSPLQLLVSYQSTNYVNQALKLVQNNIFMGGGLAVIILLVFLRSIRSVGIIALSIPVSMVGTVVIMVLMGRSINVVSLAGMAFAVGMVVDNCIVVLENIYRHLEMGKGRKSAAYEGTREVAGAVLASTLTTVAVFIPILLIEDQVGQLFRDICLSIIIAVSFSYLVSITVIPSAGALLLHKDGIEKKGNGKEPKLQRFIYWINGRTSIRVIIVLVFVSVALWGTKALTPPLDYLPKGNRNITFGLMIPPPGYNLEKLEQMGKDVEKTIQPYWEDAPNREPIPVPFSQTGETVRPPALKRYFLVARGDVIFHGGISTDASRAVDNVALFQHATNPSVVPGTYAFAFQFPLFRIGGSTGSAIKINLTGNDLEQISGATGALFGTMMQTYGPGALRPDPANFNVYPKELQIVPNQLKLAELQMTSVELSQAIQAASDGLFLGEYDKNNDLIDLKLIAQGTGDQNYLSKLKSFSVVTPSGSVAHLGELAEFRWMEAPEQIKRVGRRRAITLEFTPPQGIPLETAISSTEEIIEQLRQGGAIAPGVEIEIEGSAGKLKKIRETLLGDGTFVGTLGSSFFLAVAAVYLLMCVLFQSWIKPFIILFSVPLATLGGFVGLAILHKVSMADAYMPVQNLDMLTLLGFVILVGVVVNNAILIVAQTDHLMHGLGIENPEHKLMPAREAIALAVQSRVRPIFMSMLTSVGGMLPLVLMPGSGSELYRGLGAVVVGGMLCSTIFTLFLVPVLLSLALSLSEKFQAKKVASVTLVLLSLLIVSCESHEEVKLVEAIVPPTEWVNTTDVIGGDLQTWWTQFEDPLLISLIERARQQNLDLAMGLERLHRSRSGLSRESRNKYLTTNVGGEAKRSQYSENGNNNFFGSDAQADYNVFVQASWEMDFFGRVRENTRAAERQYEASREDLYHLHVLMSSELAQLYFAYRIQQKLESISDRNLKLQKENLRFIKARFKAGTSTQLDVNEALELIHRSQANLRQLEKQRQQFANQICVLLGAFPGALNKELEGEIQIITPSQSIVRGVPADLLRRRPDIKKQEYLVEAEASRLKIAKAEYYPKFFLSGSIGLNASHISNVPKGNSTHWSFGPNFEWRILNAMRIKDEIKIQESTLREQVLKYKKAVLQSVEEVESSLLGFTKELERQGEIKEAFRYAKSSVALARGMYLKGLRDYKSVISALLNAQLAEEQLALSRLESNKSLIQLYQALGGGWQGVITDELIED